MLSQGRSWDDILYLNFEDERLLGFEAADFNSILAAHAEMTGQKALPTMFLDEIQIIDGWEKFARRMADAEANVYIAGSNAKMLSTDVCVAPGGRFIEIPRGNPRLQTREESRAYRKARCLTIRQPMHHKQVHH